MIRRVLVGLAVLAAAIGVAPTRAPAFSPPPIKHVFVLWLENKNYVESFGLNTQAKYLTTQLAPKGAVLTNYYATGHLSLDNYITFISGQPPNPQTQADCQIFTDFAGAVGADGVAVGNGCVYPPAVKTIADQLEAKGLTWKGYMEDMDKGEGQARTCRHPEVGGSDPTQSAKMGDQYAARHNPFVYFHSIIDRPSCAANDVPLGQLDADLRSAATTASFTFITPNLCNDGHDAPCVDGRPGGLESADAFLAAWVPKILASPAMRDGLLMVTFDEAEATGTSADTSACCNEPTGPNTPSPGGPQPGPGGGRIGAVLISPWVKPGTMNPIAYNHYSALRSFEDLFGIAHLGYAGQDGLRPFGEDVYNGEGPSALPPTPASGCRSVLSLKGRRLRIRTPKAATVTLREGGRRRVLRLKPCRTRSLRLRSSRGSVKVAIRQAGSSTRRRTLRR